METLLITGLLLLLLTLIAFALPVPRSASSALWPTVGGGVARTTLLPYRWLRDTELPAMLAWLRKWSPFIRPRPDSVPEGAEASQ